MSVFSTKTRAGSLPTNQLPQRHLAVRQALKWIKHTRQILRFLRLFLSIDTQ